jgi:hypothetical protein
MDNYTITKYFKLNLDSDIQYLDCNYFTDSTYDVTFSSSSVTSIDGIWDATTTTSIDMYVYFEIYIVI